MKFSIKPFLLAAAGAVAVTSATAATYNGDLFIGFTLQSGNDVIYDIGPASSIYNGQIWDMTPAFAAAGFATAGNLKWGVIGDRTVSTVRYAWSTTDGTVAPPTIPNTPVWGTLDTPTRSIASQFTTLSLGQFVTPAASFDNSWNQQTIVGTLTTQYHNAFENPNVLGLTSASLYSIVADGSDPVLQGTFSLSSNVGVLSDFHVTFTSVPEPGSMALLGLGVGLLLTLRRQSLRKA